MHSTFEKIVKRLKTPWRYLKNRRRLLIGQRKRNTIRVFWWEDYPNFGDDLNRLISLNYGCTPVRVPASKADVVMIGSVLDLIPNEFSGAILGSGFRSGGAIRALPNATILAVRGHLSADRLAIPRDVRVLGDPGLLVAKLARKRNPSYQIGIVPHLSDRTYRGFSKLKAKFGSQCLVIDPRKTADQVLELIAQCESIFSSSLHGLITADALGIPSRWVHLNEQVIPAFKFHDYYSAFNEERIPIRIDGDESLEELMDLVLPPPLSVEEVTNELEECLVRFFSAFESQKSIQ